MSAGEFDQSASGDMQSPIFRGVAIGLLSAAFFSLTFVLNSVISLQGGPWQWTASLRYFMTIPILLFIIIIIEGPILAFTLLKFFANRIIYWVIAGTFACGLFYGGIAYAADFMPGWVVATTWQITIVASVLIVFLQARSFSAQRLMTALCVLGGVALVNWNSEVPLKEENNILATVSLVISAIAYPVGNQMLSKERQRTANSIGPHAQILKRPLAGILLLALGSLPFWLTVLWVTKPAAMISGQIVNVLLTTVFAGIIATGLFYYARNLSGDPRNVTAVDTTQSTEVVFAILFENVFVRSAVPSDFQLVGVSLVIFGVAANCFNLEKWIRG